MAKTRRVYSGNATPTTVPAGLAAGASSCTVDAATGWPGSGPFYAVLSPGTAAEEKVLVGSISGTTLSSITRGVDGTSDQTHAPGATIYPVFTATDADEANELASKWTAKGDIVSHGATTFATVSVGTNSHVLQADSAQAAGIKWGQVATAGIADDAVTAAKIATGAVGPSELASNAVETAKIADLNVTTGKLADDAVTAAKIATGAVTASELASDAVETAKIAAGAVTAAKIAAAVAGDGLAGGAGTALSVNVDNTGIEINTDTLRLKDAGVVEAKLASNAVTTAKIADANVTAAKLASNAVETAKIADANVTAAKLASNAVETAKIASSAVTFAKMEAAAPRGVVAVAVATTDSGSIGTTVADVGLSVTFTAVSGRKYLVLTHVNMRMASGTDPIGFLYITDGSNNQLVFEGQRLVGTLVVQSFQTSVYSASWSGSTTVKVRAAVNTGTWVMDNSATSPSHLIVLDIGG